MLSETICQLRRRNGLSQEQLAERIGVSRQSVSKWESGQSTPELEKLIAMSKIFCVSVDALTSGDIDSPVGPDRQSVLEDRSKYRFMGKRKLGVVLCLAGVGCLVLLGILMIAFPSSAEKISESSAIAINGSGIAFLLCAAVIVVGAVLSLKK